MLMIAACSKEAGEQATKLPEATNDRPNIVFVLVDDLRWDELGASGHPYVKTPNIDRIASEGAYFTNAFTTTPLCSPARATFLTGLYPHTSGITDNLARNEQSHRLETFPKMLNQSGYDTAFIGKWHMGNDDSPRPGFNTWAVMKGQGEAIDPEFNIDGKRQQFQGYVTDILTDMALDFVKQSGDAPFLLYLSHKALHPNVTQRDDGSITDHEHFAAIGGVADDLRSVLKGGWKPEMPLADAVMLAAPLATAVTVPSAATVATSVAPEAQVNVPPPITAPPASFATALSA